ncbi:MAG: glycosyltransferase family 39 protein [Patescibacteria group bacterium]|jgi:hypothetical protein
MIKRLKKIRWYYWALFLICLLTVLTYWRIFHFGFLSDDFDLIYDYHVYLNPFSGYRWLPIQGAVYWLIHITHLSAPIIRAFFFLFHLVNIVLVFALVKKLLKNDLMAILAAAIFAFFYRNPQEFNNMVFMLEVVLVTLILSSLLFYLKYLEEKKRKYFWLSFLFFFLSLLCKESAIILPIILTLTTFIFYQPLTIKNSKKWLIENWPFILLAVIYLGFSALTSSSVLYFSKIGYHRVSLQQGFNTYLNILAGYFPFKYQGQPLIAFNIRKGIWLLTGLIALSIAMIKTKFKPAAFFVFTILLFGIPYAFFSPFGYQEKYLYIGSFASAGLITYLLWQLTAFFGQRIQLIIFLLFIAGWLTESYLLINWRLDQWSIANQQANLVESQIRPYCPELTPDKTGLFVNFPAFVYDSQVFNFNNGLENMVKKTCGSTAEIRTIILPQSLVLSLGKAQNPPPQNQNIALIFTGSIIENRTDKYNLLEKFYHDQRLSTLDGSFSNSFYVVTSSKSNNLSADVKGKQVDLNYKIKDGEWVYVYFNGFPAPEDTKSFSFNILGDNKNETIYFDFLNRETGDYLRFSKIVDWTGWQTVSFKFSDAEIIGSKMSLVNYDDFKISIGAVTEMSGSISIKDFSTH